VNDFDAAKASLNKQFGNIKVVPKASGRKNQQDQDVAVNGSF